MSSHSGSFSDVLDIDFTFENNVPMASSHNTLQISNPSSAASSVPNTDEEDEDMMERKQSSKERRREAHTQAEKKRREAIRKGYSDLQVLIPSSLGSADGPGNSQKLSKAVVLQKSLDYIDFLQQNNTKHSEEITKLRREKQALTIMKQSYEQIVFQHQNSAGSLVGQVSDELKFEIFKEIMEKLFLTFEENVSTNNFQELSSGVISWIEEQCKPENFKAVVDNVLSSYASNWSCFC